MFVTGASVSCISLFAATLLAMVLLAKCVSCKVGSISAEAPALSYKAVTDSGSAAFDVRYQMSMCLS